MHNLLYKDLHFATVEFTANKCSKESIYFLRNDVSDHISLEMIYLLNYRVYYFVPDCQ